MNIPITTVGSQVYVFPSIATTAFQNIPQSSQDDVHICGGCKQNFSDINLFVEHKRSGCIRNNQKTPAAATALLGPAPLGYISAGSEDPLGPPIFRLIVDGSNLTLQPTIAPRTTLSARQNGDCQILRSRLLGIQNEQHVVSGQQQPQQPQQQHVGINSAGMQTLVMHHPPRREFQVDEEAVASILANQLANEDISSTQTNLPSSRTGSILVLGNIQNEMVMQESREHLDLGPIGLPSDEAVALESTPEQKPGCGNKLGGELEKNRVPGTPSKKSVPREAKEELWGQANGKNTTEIQDQAVCSLLSSIHAELSRSTESLSLMPRPRAKKRHDCTFDGCGFSTCYLKDLVRHMRRHTGERPFQCETCQRTFSRGDKLQMHLRIHSGVKPHRCDQCDYATIDSGSLRKHMRIHNDERPYKCQICPYRSRDSSQLTVHLRTHTGDNPFVCPYDSCSSAFKTSSDLKRHARMHTGEKPFACEFCDYKCAIKSNLRVHLRLNHTEAKPIPCNNCGHVSTSKRAAKEHEKTHADEVLKCGVCSYTCISTSSMKSHLRIHTQDKPFACKHCTYTCRLQGNLKAHIKKKHPDLRSTKKGKNAVKEVVPNKPGSSPRNVPKSLAHSKPYCYKSYRCTSCEAAFVREDSWRSHMRQHQAQEMIVPDNVPLDDDSSEQRQVPQIENSEQDKNSPPILETDNLDTVSGAMEQDPFMISIDSQATELKDAGKAGKQKSKAVSSTNENSGRKFKEENDEKGGQLVSLSEQEASQPLLLYVQSPPLPENVDDSLRNAEILASLNQGAPILVAGRCGQYILPTDQNIVEQLAASLQPGTTYQYVLSSPLEGVIGNEGAFIHAAAGNETELSSHVDAAVHIQSVLSLHMDKQPLVEDKN